MPLGGSRTPTSPLLGSSRGWSLHYSSSEAEMSQPYFESHGIWCRSRTVPSAFGFSGSWLNFPAGTLQGGPDCTAGTF
jgi:hypothetical protein